MNTPVFRRSYRYCWQFWDTRRKLSLKDLDPLEYNHMFDGKLFDLIESCEFLNGARTTWNRFTCKASYIPDFIAGLDGSVKWILVIVTILHFECTGSDEEACWSNPLSRIWIQCFQILVPSVLCCIVVRHRSAKNRNAMSIVSYQNSITWCHSAAQRLLTFVSAMTPSVWLFDLYCR